MKHHFKLAKSVNEFSDFLDMVMKACESNALMVRNHFQHAEYRVN